MPTWLIVVIALVAVLPGVAVILIGVIALFLSPPPHDPLLRPTTTTTTTTTERDSDDAV
jgi:hypothetical protein